MACLKSQILTGVKGVFSVSYDKTTKIISAVVSVLLLTVAITGRSVLLACLSAMVLGLSYAFSPRGYIVSEGVVLVKRLLGNARISLQGFREVRAADRNDLRGCLRLFGDGGCSATTAFPDLKAREMQLVCDESRQGGRTDRRRQTIVRVG
jgi:hypothetical protein